MTSQRVRPLKERKRLDRWFGESLAGRRNSWKIRAENRWGGPMSPGALFGRGHHTTSPLWGSHHRSSGRVGGRVSAVFESSSLIDSACATNATDLPIKAELIEACPHLGLFLLSTRLLIVTPNRGGPPTKTFNFRQGECLNNSRHCTASTPVWNSRLWGWCFLKGPDPGPFWGVSKEELPPLVVRQTFTSSQVKWKPI